VTARVVVAAGGVLWRGDPAEPEVALVHRPAYDDWSLPKGKAKLGEHVLTAAVREVIEETGHRPRLGPFVTTVRYPVTSGGRRADKTVAYWAMHSVGGTFRPNREVDELRWLPLGAAMAEVTVPRDRSVLEAFGCATRDTRPLILVRHAEAGRRRKGKPPAPSLTRAGRRQADALVPVLSAVGAPDLLSADLRSCIETLLPLAEAVGSDVRRERELILDVFSGERSSVTDRVRSAAALSDGLVICGQQRVLGALVRAMTRGTQVRVPHDLSLRQGDWWLLHHRGGDVYAVERHRAA
jgi:8-oxo-dGTP pyrophosphatase MutT (NUDIX family)/phosphohistidine phosphatase SixA